MKYILTDKKRIGIIMTLLLVAGLFLGCSSKEETENNAPSMKIKRYTESTMALQSLP